MSAHFIAGAMAGRTGFATFCTCGHAYFAPYADDGDDDHGTETSEARKAAREASYNRWEQHRTEVNG